MALGCLKQGSSKSRWLAYTVFRQYSKVVSLLRQPSQALPRSSVGCVAILGYEFKIVLCSLLLLLYEPRTLSAQADQAPDRHAGSLRTGRSSLFLEETGGN